MDNIRQIGKVIEKIVSEIFRDIFFMINTEQKILYSDGCRKQYPTENQ